MNDTTDAEQIFRLNDDQGTIVGISHNGICRSCNEDRFLIKKLSDGTVLMAVADGLGGSGAGGRGAEMTIAKLSSIDRIAKNQESHILVQFAHTLDRLISRESSKSESLEGMGTTLVCGVYRAGQFFWVHIGDSRIYLVRNGISTRLTEDQKLSRFLVDEGELTSEQVDDHYSRHVMDQFIGCGYCEPENGQVRIDSGDRIMLCSDGLHDQVPKAVLETILINEKDMENAGKMMIKAALDAGGLDNITVVLGTFTVEAP